MSRVATGGAPGSRAPGGTVRRGLVVAGATVVMAAATSCSPTPSPTGGEASPASSQAPSQEAAARARPLLPEMVERYQRMLTDIRTELTPLLGADGWSMIEPTAGSAFCQDFGRTFNTGTRILPSLAFARFVADPEWAAATAVISRVVQRYGFVAPVRVVNRVDEHRLASDDGYGADLTVQDGPRYLDIMVRTGCHLLAPP